MQHIKPMGKGDPLCPLGFHPQVRWPTRCKRCFRDYKEHGNRNKEQDYKLKRNETAASSPSLSNWNSKATEDKNRSPIGTRSWTSTSNLNVYSTQQQKNYETINADKIASSWTSTPDLVKLPNSTKADSEPVRTTLPRRRPFKEEVSDDDYRRTAYTVRRRTSSTLNTKQTPDICLQNTKITNDTYTTNKGKKSIHDKEDNESDVFTDAASSINTDDTETITNSSAFQEQIDSLKSELNTMRIRCKKAEKEKNEMLLRRVASLDNSMSTKTTTTELTRLQEKINVLTETCDVLKNEKKTLTVKLQELENSKKSEKADSLETEISSLKSKLHAAESLCEELMDENEEMKRELKDMEEEIEEMQDNFRDSQADEYTSIKKELEQTGKNCRILSFKLRKCERKAEQLEADKFECERKLKEAIQKLQKELDEANEKLRLNNTEDARKKAPMLGNIPQTPSGEKVSRASLTRGGSQEDPAQLLRDLQDSMEREADLREQLRYAEEEAENLRKKVTRVEDDNESLLMQLKKMATKAKSHKSSPTHSRLNPELSVEKDEGISDDDDPTELRLLLELSEQETAVLHKKVDELQENCDILKRKASDLQEKLLAKEQKSSREWKSKDSAKTLERENEMKKKLQEKERECKQLNSELNCLKKKSKLLQATRSLDDDQESVNLQRQLKIVEQEANVLRARIYSLETENEALQNENKQLTISKLSKKNISTVESELKSKITALERQLIEARKLKLKNLDEKTSNEIKELTEKCNMLESENSRLTMSLQLLKEGNAKKMKEFHQERAPKIVTDLTPRNVLKKMIEDLERENGEILASYVKCEANVAESYQQEIQRLSTELEKMKQQLAKVTNEHKKEKTALEKEIEKLQNEKKNLETVKMKNSEVKEKERSTLKKEKDKIKEEKKKLLSEMEKVKLHAVTLEEDLKNAQIKHNETNDLLAAAYRELQEECAAGEILKKQLESAENSVKNEAQLKLEVSEKTIKLAELEKKVQGMEVKIKKSEKLLQTKKENKLNLEKEIEKLKKENEDMKNIQLKNETEFKNNNEELRRKFEQKCNELREKESRIKELEITLSQKSNNSNPTSTSNVKELENKLSNAQNELKKLTEKIKSLEEEKKIAEEQVTAVSKNLKTNIDSLKENTEKIKIELESEKALTQQLKEDYKKENLAKDTELKMLKKKILHAGDKKVNDVKKEFESLIESLNNQLEAKKREYDELTNKYELLEDEHVKIKSQANLQKEQLQSQVLCAQKELTTVQNDLHTLREMFNNKQDNWIKGKLRLEEKLADLENHKLNGETYKLELNKLKLTIDEKDSELEKLHKENNTHIGQMEHLRKENEELKKKLDDYDKVIHVQRSMVAEASLLETELRELKAKLHNEEQGRKVEIAALKLRYENHIATISSELKDVQSQLMRFKHERNTYKHLLENAQKAVTEVKNTASSKNINNPDEVEELRSQVATLEQQISCMEDELSESRVECSRLKTELVSERSAWDIKLSEMTSRINELEEERLLHSGRTKSVGLKTRMELAWQKEREEQNRLLQETSTLARDLRQTLFEVERERDKERLEMKRRIDLMKKSAEEEQEETKKKLNELQCDLLELRDAHAKLRTTNEKLRREKEKMDRERDLLKQNVRLDSVHHDHKINYILDLIGELSKTVSYFGDKNIPPLPTKKQITASRESSVDLKNTSRESSVSKEDPNMQFQQMLKRLIEAARTVKINQNNHESTINKELTRKAFISRRPASIESEKNRENYVNLHRRGSLYRKCISLEQTSPSTESHEQIWRMDDDTDGSITSIQSIDDSYLPKNRCDTSFDSRLSGGSTRSEMLPSTIEKKKKKGFFGKLKKLAKSSRSVDDDAESCLISYSSQGNKGSSSSISSSIIPDHESISKRDLKGRITDLFKTADSRCSSLERNSLLQLNNFEEVCHMQKKQDDESRTLPRRKTKVENISGSKYEITLPRNFHFRKKN